MRPSAVRTRFEVPSVATPIRWPGLARAVVCGLLLATARPALADGCPELSGFYEGSITTYESGAPIEQSGAHLDIDQEGTAIAGDFFVEFNGHFDAVQDGFTFVGVDDSGEQVFGSLAGDVLTVTFGDIASFGLQFVGSRPPHGACCYGDVCSFDSESYCVSHGGVYMGDHTSCCDTSFCAPVTGACCAPDGSCATMSHNECLALGGTFKGDGSDCSNEPCGSTVFWKDAVSGPYDVAENWDPQQVPTATHKDVAIFDRSGAYTVSFPGPATSERALVRNGLPTFSGAAYQLSATSPDSPALAIGSGGTLTLLNCPGLALSHARVGDVAPGLATLNLFDSNLSANGFLEIGELAAARVNVIGSSLLNTQDSRVGAKEPGEVIVDGDAAEWSAGNLAVGFGASGALTVQGGGTVAAHNTFVGFHNGLLNGEGVLAVKGVGDSQPSRLDVVGDLRVGVSNTGTLTLLDGAAGAAANILLAENGGIEGNLTVQGKSPDGTTPTDLSAFAKLTVGQSGSGHLLVSGGAHLSTGTAVLAENPGSFANAEVIGEGTLWGTGAGEFVVGDSGQAALSITAGAIVASTFAIIGHTAGNSGVIVKDGPANGEAAWRISNDLIVAGTGGGALAIDNAFVHVIGSLSVGNSPAGGGGGVLLQAFGKLKADGNSIIGSFGQLNGNGLYACPLHKSPRVATSTPASAWPARFSS